MNAKKFVYHTIMLLLSIEFFLNFLLTETVRISERPDNKSQDK